MTKKELIARLKQLNALLDSVVCDAMDHYNDDDARNTALTTLESESYTMESAINATIKALEV